MSSLEHLKVGDKVVSFSGNFGHHGYAVLTIMSDTRTQWITTDNSRWRKSDGRGIGFSRRHYIEEITEENRATMKEIKDDNLRKQMWREIQELKDNRNVTTERLKEILAELKASAR